MTHKVVTAVPGEMGRICGLKNPSQISEPVSPESMMNQISEPVSPEWHDVSNPSRRTINGQSMRFRLY